MFYSSRGGLDYTSPAAARPAAPPMTAPRLRLLLLPLVAALAVAAPAAAQPAGVPPEFGADTVKERRAAVEARTDLEPATRTRILDLYQQALGELERAAKLRADTENARRQTAEAPGEIRRLERTLDQMQRTDPPGTAGTALDRLDILELERRDAAARERAAEARQAVEDLDRAVDEGASATLGLRGRQERIRGNLEALRTDLAAAPPRGQASALAEAGRTLAQTRLLALQAELGNIESHLAYQPAAQRLRELRRDIARLEVERAEAAQRRLLSVLEQRRIEDAERARAAAGKADSEFSAQPTAVRALNAVNAELTATLAETTVALDRALLEVSRLRSASADLAGSIRLIERRAESRTLGREFAQTLIERMRRLPRSEDFARTREERDPLLSQTNDANFRVERELEGLASLDEATARFMKALGAAVPEGERPRTEAAVREHLARQRALLTRLDEQQDALVRALGEVEEAEDELSRQAQDAQQRLIRLLFWVPLSPLGEQTIRNLEPAVRWMLDAANWRAAGTALVREARRYAPLTLLVLVAAAALYAGRRRLKAKLESLAPDAQPAGRYRIGHTLAALGLTVALALTLPLLLRYAGWLLLHALNASAFVQSLGHALAVTGQLFLNFYAFSWLFDRRGVAIRHFRWHADSTAWLRTAIRRFTLLFLPLIFVVTLNGGLAPHGNAESVGRVAFLLAMLAVAAFLHRLFRRGSPPMKRFFLLHSRSWPAKLYPLWYAALVALPLAIGVLAASGFYFAAGYLFGRVMDMLLLALATMMAYGLVSLWVVMQRTRLAERQEQGADSAPAAAHTEVSAARVEEIDINAIGDQTRQLLNLFTTVVVAAGLWLIWRDALPALEVVGDFALWSYTETVDGERVTRALTLGGLVLAFLVAVVTTMTVRNIGAALDIVLLQRLELQADATYAIKTVTRYAIAGVGIVLATGILGISWGKLQWLVAALGVGLGFGLQEIVANFVSGLIVLAERPIRIGDVVTVGDVTGTVSRIRARATSVVDFDNKEVLIPNKAFITQQVINWTLSSQTTRLLLKVGVAYGTDIEQARDVIYKAVRANPDVLVDPPYSVFFVGFGDSALNFEIRAYVDEIDKRLRVTHALNVAIEQALRENGIGIPFPQREVTVRGLPPFAPAAAPPPPAPPGA